MTLTPQQRKELLSSLSEAVRDDPEGWTNELLIYVDKAGEDMEQWWKDWCTDEPSQCDQPPRHR